MWAGSVMFDVLDFVGACIPAEDIIVYLTAALDQVRVCIPGRIILGW